MKTDYPYLGQGRIMKTQTENKHTPGPWVSLEFAGEHPNVGIAVGNDSPADRRDKGKYWIASVPLVCPLGSATPGAPLPGASPDEARANAALIAAAPAMLEALRDAANAHAFIDEEYPCGTCEVNRRPQWLEDVENAIAAAEGKKPTNSDPAMFKRNKEKQ
jgi:hypothetical protein